MSSVLLKKKLECKHCGHPFKPERKNQVYCCKGCAHAIRLPDPAVDTVTCPLCKNSFLRHRRDQVYCSKTCRQMFNLEQTETLHIPKSVFEGTRPEIVAKLESWLEGKGYLLMD